jgi:hypothetical protein
MQRIKKLHDLLSLPVAVRPLLDGELDFYGGASRAIDVKETYNNVLLLAEAYNSLLSD